MNAATAKALRDWIVSVNSTLECLAADTFFRGMSHPAIKNLREESKNLYEALAVEEKPPTPPEPGKEPAK